MPVIPTIVPWVNGVEVLGTPTIFVCVVPDPAEKLTARLARSNWHIASPKTWLQVGCHSRRGIWIFKSSRCDRHFMSIPVRLQSMSEIRPANITTVPTTAP